MVVDCESPQALAPFREEGEKKKKQQQRREERQEGNRRDERKQDGVKIYQSLQAITRASKKKTHELPSTSFPPPHLPSHPIPSPLL